MKESDAIKKLDFYCDKIWWSELSEKDRVYWADWAASCGANKEPILMDRNPDYPNMICMPHVSLGVADDYIMTLFE